MFEEHLEAAKSKTGIEFSQQAIVFLHYCVTRGIKVILERSEGPEPMTAPDVAMGMHRQLKALEKQGIKVEEASVHPDLPPLILFVAHTRGVKIQEEALDYTNRLVNSVTRLLVLRSADIALARNRKKAEPEDTDIATRDIFGQGWFGW